MRAPPNGNVAIFDVGAISPTPRKLLVTKLDHVGDFMMALPALEKLRKAFREDHITLVCGPWNEPFARSTGYFDDLRLFSFFPESGADWVGSSVEDVARFHEIVGGPFDIAIDLRVDDDTRFLLNHVDARLKCGIGKRRDHPFLDVLLPAQFGGRASEPMTLRIEPDRFQSRMPIKTLIYHETDFSVTNQHLIYGCDVVLPAGSFRATWGLDLQVPFRCWPGVEIVVDVARNRGKDIIARRAAWQGRADPRYPVSIEFTNTEPHVAYEFRLRARGRPRCARLRFYGLWVERLDHPPPSRFKPSELHIGEQLSGLVQLVEDRTRSFKSTAEFACNSPFTEGGCRVMAPWPPASKRIIMAPFSNSRIRDWGLNNYSRLARLLLENQRCSIALVGSMPQRDLLATIASEHGSDSRIINLAGRTDWLTCAALIREADLVISNNSGIAHLAAACGIRTLAIYSGSHQPQEWGPRGDARVLMAVVPCSPCGHDKLEMCHNDHLCMKLIEPDVVAAEAIAMLSGEPTSP